MVVSVVLVPSRQIHLQLVQSSAMIKLVTQCIRIFVCLMCLPILSVLLYYCHRGVAKLARLCVRIT